MRGSDRLMIVAALAVLTAGVAAQPSADLDGLLTRVGERLTEYYKRAQNVICIEKSTVQPIGFGYSPEGFARVTESELRVEFALGDGDAPGEAKVIRQIRKIQGRAPRERDKKDRAACTDPNPLSIEPLAFLLPARRTDHRFVAAGIGKGRDRNALLIEFTPAAPNRRPELVEDERGHEDCYDWTGPLPTKGRIWVDPNTYDVLRVEWRTLGPVDIRVPMRLQRGRHLEDRVVVEREDTTIRFKTVVFRDPDETMLLPESIESLVVVRGGLQSTRRSQVYSDYRRFVTGARIVK